MFQNTEEKIPKYSRQQEKADNIWKLRNPSDFAIATLEIGKESYC